MPSFQIHPLTLPAPIPAGSVNACFIDGETPTLIDTGFFTEPSRNALSCQLESLGSSIQSLGRVVITHGHFDHAGTARDISRRNRAPLHAHGRSSILHRMQPEMLEKLRSFIRRCGAPEDFLTTVMTAFQRVSRLADLQSEPYEVRPMRDGELLSVNGIEFQILETPGHSHDSICLFDSESRTLLAGDTLLAEITPNPVLYFDPDHGNRPAPSLAQYITSLQRLQALDARMALGGHGPAIPDVNGLIETNLGLIEKRKGRVLEKINGPAATPYELAAAIFGRLAYMETFLALSETIAYLVWFDGRQIPALDWDADPITLR